MAIKLHSSFAVPPGPWLKRNVIDHFALSVTDAADHLGVSRQSMSKLLNGRQGLSAEMAIDELHDLVIRLDVMKVRFAPAAKPTPEVICISNFGGAIERIDSTGRHMVAEIGCDGLDAADRVSRLMNELAYHYLGKPRVRNWFAKN